MRHIRSSVIVPSLLAFLALPLHAAEGDAGTTATPAASTEASPEAHAQQVFIQAQAEFTAAHFPEALTLTEEVLRLAPDHAGAKQLRSDTRAVLAVRSDRLQMAASYFRALQDVKTQETVIRLHSLVESGDRKMATKDYAGAELDYDRVDTGLRTFPYAFDWGTLPQDVANKRAEARQRARQAEAARQADARSEAEAEANRQRDVQEEALRIKVDELLRRARTSLARNDYKRAEVDAWNAYELDRRRDDARDLYLKAREEGHTQFDDTYEDQRSERLARVHEEIHKALIPQNELLIYPEDWHIRALRKPQELGISREEPWMVELRARLEQRISTPWADTPFEEAVAYLQKVSGVNILVAPDVAAAGVPNVSLKVEKMRLDDVLKWMCALSQLTYAPYNQAIYISKTPIRSGAALKMYDVTDLVSPPPDFPGKELGYSSLSSGNATQAANLFGNSGSNNEQVNAIKPEKLVEFIQANVAHETWAKEGSGFGIEVRNNTLLVTQSAETHAQIEKLLTHMRNQHNLQVKLDVRLLDVRKNFMEEVGFEFTDPAGAQGGLVQGSATENNQRISTNESSLTTPTGYQRLNGNTNNGTAYLGKTTQSLPGNAYQSTVSSTGSGTRGLVLDGSYHQSSFLGTDQINALFSALEEEVDAQNVNQPELVVFNGQRASTTWINQYAYISDYNVQSFNLTPQVKVLNTGDILDVRPVVSSDRKYITLEIRPNNVSRGDSTLVTLYAPYVNPTVATVTTITTDGILNNSNIVPYTLELPKIEINALKSTVMLPDKGTLLLGGFTSALKQRTHSGVPFLSHIPFLGRLFSKNGTYDQNRRAFFMLSAEVFDQNEREKQR